MKKPINVRKNSIKVRQIGYFLEIKTVRGEEWIYPEACRSLQEAVELASLEVQDMDNYLKVYRHSRAAGGVYIAPFQSVPTESQPARTIIVQITNYEMLTPKEIEDSLKYIARISRGEKAR